MAGTFEKLNLKDQQELVALNAPESFQPELARLQKVTIHDHLEPVKETGFLLAFVTRKSEMDALAPQIAKRARGDAIVWLEHFRNTCRLFECCERWLFLEEKAA